MSMLKETGVLLAMAYFSWKDIRSRCLPDRGIYFFLGIGAVFLFGRIGSYGWQVCASLGAGIFFILISLLSKGDLGMGDALLVLGMGGYFDGEEMLLFVVLGMLLGMVWAGGLFLKKRNGRQTFPLVPFLLAGYVGGLNLWKWG